MSWNRVIGQKQQVRVLSNALEKGRLAHAYLFSGPEGSGKEMTALEVAAALNCRSPDAVRNGACGTCPDCLQIREFMHPNVEYLFPVEAALLEGGDSQKKDNKKFTEAREQFLALIEKKKENPYFSPAMDRSMGILTEQVVALQQKASFMPREGTRKVFIISQAEKLHPSAANKLLKLLEEPPAHVLFVLVTSRPDSLLATIRSRCQEIRFQRVAAVDLRKWLEENRPEIVDPELGFIVNFSRGNLKLAWELIAGKDEASSEPATIAIRRMALDYLRKVLAPKRFHEALTASEEHAKNLSRTELVLFIGAILLFLQDTCHRRITPEFRNLNNPDITDAVDRFAKNFPNPDYLGVSTLAEESIRAIERNASPLLVMAAFTAALRPLLQRA
ncbi:MAG: DNA polymerase III subunit delta' [Pelodictyon luteolum]|uniref:DNA polymerase III subunit delta n=1 Tax=Pelodictyon luteolum TaxID=1100 RepID=A0A165LI59_PELLU|nr:DNA polymerase III subunit [Pelodictyon luteolum]KZK74076.1 MAG: DNA polymerase III subunit delta' [Pelodictyon luteolum]